MLFNSHEFLFAFLPTTLLGFFLLGSRGWRRAAFAWLTAASLFYYGWWDFRYVGLIGFSIAFNATVGRFLGARNASGRRGLLAVGVAVNLALLGYFKYANFFVDTLNAVTGSGIHLEHIVLPLGISFFTFQQIAYLVDAHRGLAREYNLINYSLFVCFFPQLIAGPIVHHREMMPQFGGRTTFRLSSSDVAVGLTILFIGLFKKVVFADTAATFASPVYDSAAMGLAPTAAEAWIGTVAYTMQLYFDFSGYSDMAIGAARLFGIRLPINFDSPYKAVNIIDFWRRWHVTLSRFLRDYLYIPLGGNRHGVARRHVNLMVTMVLGGLWHGAGWTFVLWGALHGLYLVANHGWRHLRRLAGQDVERSTPAGRVAGRAVTFLVVMLAWVFFRAADTETALLVLRAMAGLGEGAARATDFELDDALEWVLPLLLVCWLAPNTQQWLERYRPALNARLAGRLPVPARWRRLWRAVQWRPSVTWAVVTALIGILAVLSLVKRSEFIYFQF
jgi:D-alanyl-lipoteichoic acid acyltransferase DltB (MBOAT superfamily)